MEKAGGSVKILAAPKDEPAEPKGKNKRMALEAAKGGGKGEGKPKGGKAKAEAEAEGEAPSSPARVIARDADVTVPGFRSDGGGLSTA